ncbi:hypothetical protein L7F22_064351 [Adiantum nelumboides]|nr:hypothetical protein [Adiantum nelumboides]
MGPDGQRINAPGSKAETSQVEGEGEDHLEEAGVSNKLGQPSRATNEKRKHSLVAIQILTILMSNWRLRVTKAKKHPPRSSLLKALKRRKRMKNPHGLVSIYKLMRLTFLLGV